MESHVKIFTICVFRSKLGNFLAFNNQEYYIGVNLGVLFLLKKEMEVRKMNERKYYSMFKNEPDVLTVPDVVRLLKLGKNTVYKLINDGTISSIKMGKKIIIPKVCLVEFLTNEKNYQTPSPTVKK
jgi:excisionase family DNA binding protein